LIDDPSYVPFLYADHFALGIHNLGSKGLIFESKDSGSDRWFPAQDLDRCDGVRVSVESLVLSLKIA